MLSAVSACGATDSPDNAPLNAPESASSTTEPAIGPDAAGVKEEFLPVISAHQAATEAALAEVGWLGEPSFSYRQSVTNVTVATLAVTGTTQASADASDDWLGQTNGVLGTHGFEAIDEFRVDEGNGLLLVSAKPASDACFTARWGQGTVVITIEVGAPDSLCRLG